MFKDTKEGQTHYKNDGCGESEHSTPAPKGEERVAMNIVYQIGDLLGASVEKRQATNDVAIDFVWNILRTQIKIAREEVLKEVESAIVEEILICHKEGTPTSRLTSLAMRLKKV